MSFVSFEGVTRAYHTGQETIHPVKDLHLQVERGEFLVLLGPSGSGKSTLLNLTAGIDRPDAGRVTVDGQPLHTLRSGRAADWRARTIGYVFQDHHLVPTLTAEENVEIPLWLHSMRRSERKKRVAFALELVGLSDRATHRPGQLSGGQNQRVAIARAIVADPPLILADEPTGNLDERAASGVLTLFARLNVEREKTLLLVTHDPRTTRHATRALHLDKGTLTPFAVEELA